MSHDTLICETQLIDLLTCTLPSHVWRDSFIRRVSCILHIRDTMYSQVRHGSFIKETWLFHMRDTTHLYTRHDAFIRETWRIYMWDIWRIYMWDMTHSYVSVETSYPLSYFSVGIRYGNNHMIICGATRDVNQNTPGGCTSQWPDRPSPQRETRKYILLGPEARPQYHCVPRNVFLWRRLMR